MKDQEVKMSFNHIKSLSRPNAKLKVLLFDCIIVMLLKAHIGTGIAN